MMKRLLMIVVMLGAIGGGYWLWQQPGQVSQITNQVVKKIKTEPLIAFKTAFTADALMEKNKKELLTDSGTFLEAELHFYPCLLMQIKYVEEGSKSREGHLLWGLSNGEMVVNATTWETTHGFEDCLNAHLKDQEFQLIRLVAENGGQCERSLVMQKMRGQPVDTWIKNAISKKLLVENGQKLQLHFHDPRIEKYPATKITLSQLVQYPKTGVRHSQEYNAAVVEKFVSQFFGKNLAIRTAQEVFLPAYALTVQYPDGSLSTTYWNAVTGQQIKKSL